MIGLFEKFDTGPWDVPCDEEWPDGWEDRFVPEMDSIVSMLNVEMPDFNPEATALNKDMLRQRLGRQDRNFFPKMVSSQNKAHTYSKISEDRLHALLVAGESLINKTLSKKTLKLQKKRQRLIEFELVKPWGRSLGRNQ